MLPCRNLPSVSFANRLAGSLKQGSTGRRTCCAAVPQRNLPWYRPVRSETHGYLSIHIQFPHNLAEPTPDHPHPQVRKCTYLELYSLVADLVSALLLYGLKPGDRVASYSSNCIVSLAFYHVGVHGSMCTLCYHIGSGILGSL